MVDGCALTRPRVECFSVSRQTAGASLPATRQLSVAQAAPPARRALVTGGSRGIGASIVAELERRGLAVTAPRRAELDLARPESLDAFIAAQLAPGFDVIVNNAGINIVKPLAAIDAATWQQMVQVNLTAPLRLTQAFAPAMQERGYGRIVNISSVFSLVTKEGRASYSAVKAGLNGLTRTSAVELGPCGILVNAVCPGYVETEMTSQNNSPADLERIRATIPLRRLARAEEVARFVGFLCSDDNSYVTGQLLAIDGGFSCQ